MNDIDALLQSADPLAGQPMNAVPAGLARDLAELTMTEPTYKSFKRRHRGLIALGIIGVLAGVPTAALAITGGIHTGEYPRAGDTESHPGEEILNLSDPGIVPLVKKETTTVPIPPGRSWNKLLGRWPIALQDGVGTTGQFRVVIDEVDGTAKCFWDQDWLAGDAATRARDIKVIDRIPTRAFAQNQADDGGQNELRDEVYQMDRGQDTLAQQYVQANCDDD